MSVRTGPATNAGAGARAHAIARRLPRLARVAVLLSLAAHATPAQAPAAEVRVHPERATVGEPVTVTARVTAPRGAVIEFPAVVGGGESVEALDPRVVRQREGGTEVVAEATWRVVAWDTGSHPLPLGDATISVRGVLTRVPLPTMMLAVASVLPVDAAEREPRPARDIVEVAAPWWDAWMPWLVPLLALGLAAALWRRNRRDRPAPEVGALDAERAFARLNSGALAATGEPGREVAIATEIVRDFLAARFEGAGIALTTSEVLAALPLRSTPTRAMIAEVLTFADLVKYARRTVSPAEAVAFTRRAHAVVTQVLATEGGATPAAA